MTAARIPITVKVENLPDLEGELLRFAAPLTVAEMVKHMPIEGFLARWENAIYIITNIQRGVEKSTPKLSAGDIFYWSPEKVVGIALNEHVARAQTLKVGRMISDYSLLEKARVGSRMRFVLKA